MTAHSLPNISPLAVVSPKAKVGHGVEIGPFCVVEADVTIGDGCKLESRVVVKSGTTLGANNHLFEGAVIGGLPQHISPPGPPGRIRIGSENIFRENVTIHRAMTEESTTIIGDNNFLMVNVHIAHDCQVGNHTIFANNAMLAGHVTVADRAYASGAMAVHQFCRIGTLAMVGGQSHVHKDVPPFVTVDGISNFVVGLNQIGLRRAGYQQDEIRQLKEAYRVIYRSEMNWQGVLNQLQEQFSEGPAAEFYEFLSTTKRGITPERRLPPGATIKLRREPETAPRLRAKAS